jgi:hypothetical protein
MEEYDQMDVSTSAAFDIFFSGILPIGYSIYFEPLLSTTLKSKIEDFVFFFVEPLISLFYAFNKITYNQFTNKHLIFICATVSYRIATFIIYHSILIWIKKKKRYFGYKSFEHCILFFYINTSEYFARHFPMLFLEEPLKPETWILNGVALLGIIFAFFLFVIILPYALYKNKRNFPIFGIIIYSTFIFSSFYVSIGYLVVIPSNVVYVKISFNINLLLLMRFFTITNEKPSNKNRGITCIILFAFDDIDNMEKELRNKPKVQDWYMKYLTNPMIKQIIDEITKRMTSKNDKEYYEDESNCNKANILYYYKYGKDLKEKRDKAQSGSTLLFGNSDDEFTLETYIPGINLHNEIKTANKVYKLFNGIGVDKINNVESFSAKDIARIEDDEIERIINNP